MYRVRSVWKVREKNISDKDILESQGKSGENFFFMTIGQRKSGNFFSKDHFSF